MLKIKQYATFATQSLTARVVEAGILVRLIGLAPDGRLCRFLRGHGNDQCLARRYINGESDIDFDALDRRSRNDLAVWF